MDWRILGWRIASIFHSDGPGGCISKTMEYSMDKMLLNFMADIKYLQSSFLSIPPFLIPLRNRYPVTLPTPSYIFISDNTTVCQYPALLPLRLYCAKMLEAPKPLQRSSILADRMLSKGLDQDMNETTLLSILRFANILSIA